MSIPTFVNKIKGRAGEHKQRLIYMAVLAAVAATAFYLGYVARAESHAEPMVAINCPADAYMDALALSEQGSKPTASVPKTAAPAGSGAYVASKNGTKYYPVGCAGAKRIKEENKVFYPSAAAAVSAGLALAATCN